MTDKWFTKLFYSDEDDIETKTTQRMLTESQSKQDGALNSFFEENGF
jgi:hypothetical protein